jgi:hypothetical protein
LPFIEEEALHQLGSDGQPEVITQAQREGAAIRDATPVGALFCPTRRAAQAYPKTAHPYNMHNSIAKPEGVGEPVSLTDYAANMGPRGSNPQLGPAPGGPSGNNMPSMDAWMSNPDFHVLAHQPGVIYLGSRVRISHITVGTTKTYMIGEKYLNADQYGEGGTDFTDTEPAWTGNNDDKWSTTWRVPSCDSNG